MTGMFPGCICWKPDVSAYVAASNAAADCQGKRVEKYAKVRL